jgi:hypothetical protein
MHTNFASCTRSPRWFPESEREFLQTEALDGERNLSKRNFSLDLFHQDERFVKGNSKGKASFGIQFSIQGNGKTRLGTRKYSQQHFGITDFPGCPG